MVYPVEMPGLSHKAQPRLFTAVWEVVIFLKKVKKLYDASAIIEEVRDAVWKVHTEATVCYMEAHVRKLLGIMKEVVYNARFN